MLSGFASSFLIHPGTFPASGTFGSSKVLIFPSHFPMCSGSSKYFPIVDYLIPQDLNVNDVPSSGEGCGPAFFMHDTGIRQMEIIISC